MDDIKEMEKQMDEVSQADKKVDNSIDPTTFLSTGSTLLNLACSDSAFGGLSAGKYYLLVGDASAGKTFLAMTCLAEACLNPAFAKHRLIYDNIEDGCLLDLNRLFPHQLKARLTAPKIDDEGDPLYSSTVEEFYCNLDDVLAEGPVIYILDSMDALTTEQDDVVFDKMKSAQSSKKESPGSYGTSKARKNSEYLRRALGDIRKTSSILIILSQTRDDLGFGFQKKTRSGGHALRFYATTEIWASIKSPVKKHYKGKDRQIGVHVQWKVKKNRITGKLHEVFFDVFPSYGIDDLGSCLDFLVDEGYLSQSKYSIVVPTLNLSGTKQKLLREIEDQNKGDEIRRMTEECWMMIQESGKLDRRDRYATLDSV